MGYGRCTSQLTYLRAPVVGALNEWHGVHRLTDLEVDTMTVVGYSNVFAIGDAAATDPLRSSARNWAYRIVCRNINALIQGKFPAHRFQPPGSRWGSVLGLQSNGLTLHQQNGRRHRLPVWFVQLILWPWIVTRGIYGGIRKDTSRHQVSNGLNNGG